ncbi:hypothetical protein BDK51DRAFT_51354 [Blyttiomyces helicus]|uniref:Uncharacterized protein n=1 Tax=Blyttiomyces helicus TaxID=388810 RepID=A0A4V1IPT2_9FUNG|nr:hypothetical protein BDK51DRAFT_51354 [Blyttiomyces helicus]|eukprot:RKO84147.1 hypothetical protein BDK51DRAFT_51354 [Blyttiomyces helicus]
MARVEGDRSHRLASASPLVAIPARGLVPRPTEAPPPPVRATCSLAIPPVVALDLSPPPVDSAHARETLPIAYARSPYVDSRTATTQTPPVKDARSAGKMAPSPALGNTTLTFYVFRSGVPDVVEYGKSLGASIVGEDEASGRGKRPRNNAEGAGNYFAGQAFGNTSVPPSAITSILQSIYPSQELPTLESQYSQAGTADLLIPGENPNFGIAAAIVTDAHFLCTHYRIHKALHAAGIPSFAYRYSQIIANPNCSGNPPPFFGAAHTFEVPFVFGSEIQTRATHISLAATGVPTVGAATWPRFPAFIELQAPFSFAPVSLTAEYDAKCAVWDVITEIQSAAHSSYSNSTSSSTKTLTPASSSASTSTSTSTSTSAPSPGSSSSSTRSCWRTLGAAASFVVVLLLFVF